MIKLTDINGRAVFVNPWEISSLVSHPSIHTNATLHTNNGVRHEVRETAEEIAKKVSEEKAKSRAWGAT